MDHKTYTMIESYMLSCMKDSAHDKDHVDRVLYHALDIAQGECGVDMDVLITACLLHDIARSEQLADPSVCHALYGGDKAYRFLVENGFDAVKSEHVRQCIRTHRFRKSCQPASIEAKILFDADKLDVTGAIGIARTLIYNGEVSRPVYNTRADGRVSDGSQDETDSFFHEYRFKLEKIYGRFYTERGALLAKQRQKAAVQFYEALYGEVAQAYTQGQKLLARAMEHRDTDA
ncbi:MAG: HD domain-containing protein [Clostridia bacterium]|nr:HD domain-containing protein [Clostridia bacterium]